MDSDAQQLTKEIIRTFQARGKALYSSGEGYLTYSGLNSSEITVYRREGNDRRCWKVPIRALEETVRQARAQRRPLRAGECNAICKRRGAPLAALLRLLPEERYRGT